MRLIFSFSIFFLSSISWSQHLLPIQYDTNTYNQEIILYGIADFSASSIQNEIGKKFIYGGYISNDMKDNSFAQHKGINRVGLDAGGEIEYRNLKANIFKNNFGFIIKGGYNNYLSLLYSKDLFGLSFYGNENYLGENINFSGSRFQAMSFQKIGFGLIDKKSKSNASLNFYSISNYYEGNVREGQLFQSENGDSMSLTLDGTFDYASSSKFMKGYGVGIDLDLRIPVSLRKEKISYVQILVKNLGFAHINSPVTHYEADTTFTYNGLTFDQLYGDSKIFNGQFSVLDTLGIDSLTTSKFRFLPGFIQAGKIVDDLSQSKVQSFFGIRMYPSLNYAPMVYAGVQFRTTKWLDLAANVSFGGYTGFRAGFYGNVKFENFAVGISSEDILGFISNKARGQSLILRLRCRF